MLKLTDRTKWTNWLDKLGRVALSLVLALALAGCVADDGSVHQGQTDENASDYMSLTTLEEYGVAPLELTVRDEQLLAALPFAGYDNILLAEFYAPEEATTLLLESWYLDENGEWQNDFRIKKDLADISNPYEVGRGVISVYWADGIAPELYMGESYYGGGHASRHSGEVWGAPEETPEDGYATMQKHLFKPAEIVLGEPIPLSIISLHAMDDGQEVFGLSDYFNTEKFAGNLYTGAVTVTFLNDAGEDQGDKAN